MRILESRLAQRARRNPHVRPPLIAAYRAIDRTLPAPKGPRILANSMPKSGTHLLMSLLENLPKLRFAGHFVSYLGKDAIGEREEFTHLIRRLRLLRDSHYIGAHLTYDPAVERAVDEAGARMVTILRDPRSHILSWAHYLLATRHVPGREWVTDRYPDMASLLPALVRGIGVPGVIPICQMWASGSVDIRVGASQISGSRCGSRTLWVRAVAATTGARMKLRMRCSSTSATPVRAPRRTALQTEFSQRTRQPSERVKSILGAKSFPRTWQRKLSTGAGS